MQRVEVKEYEAEEKEEEDGEDPKREEKWYPEN